MTGQMINSPLTITSLMAFGEKIHADTEIVSVTIDNSLFRYTFADAFRRARRLANALARLGAKFGDRIGTLAWNDHRHFELYFAVNCSGMICHTINPRLFLEQIDYIINHAEDQFVFTDVVFLPLLEKLKDRLSTVKGIIVMTDQAHMPVTSMTNVHCYETLLAAESDLFNWPELNELDASGLCYTSGTTGNPKGVLYNHRNTVLFAMTGISVLGLGKNDAVLPIAPMFHVNAWGIPYCSVVTGSKIVFPGRKMADGETLTSLINEEKITYSAGVPTIWMALLDYLKQSGATVDSLRRVTTGGAACPLSIMEDFDKYGVYTDVGWGMTESTLGSYNSDLDRSVLGEEEFARLRVKAGRVIYGIEMKITDDDNNELPWDGEAFGALKIRGPFVCDGYFKIEHSKAHHADGWFDTGDIATIDSTGMLQITDRRKDIIKSGGEWISSMDLENVAVDHPFVVEAAVIGVHHKKWIERPLLLVIKHPNVELSKEDMLAWFNGKVANWWIPDDCLFVEELPHTGTGKLSKKDLREQYKDYSLST